jgi:Zn-dependent protease with chaperone function
MDQSELKTFITKLEDYSSVHPDRYRMRVMLVAALGYAYLASVVIGLLGTVYVTLLYIRFSAVTIKLIWIPLVLVGLIIRSLWVTIPEPDGRPLSETEARPLLTLINEIRKELNGPTVHTVLLSDEFNAGIVQIPRFGMFGWLKNYLVVGLPLLTALGPDQLRAVLAHEFGHLSGSHGNFAGWIYRVRESWVQILTAVQEERNYASFLFMPFLKWYAPFFKAYSFVLARRQEYDADQSAAKLAGKETIAKALVQIALTQREINEEFWPEFFRGAREDSQPPKDPFTQLVRKIEHTNASPNASKWFLQEMRVKTGYDDTHPALADRLVALGFAPESLTSTSVVNSLAVEQFKANNSAAHHYLNDVPDEFTAKSNRLWREQVHSGWRETYVEIAAARKRLEELNKQAETTQLSVDERWERSGHIQKIEGPEAATIALKELVADAPDYTPANFVLGSFLLKQNDADGLQLLKIAKEADPELTGIIFELMSDFYLEQGRIKEADDYAARAAQYYETAQQVNEQAVALSANDRFEPHELISAEVQEVRDQLAQVRGLARAMLVRKFVGASEQPIYVMGVVAEYTWRDGQNDKHVDALLDELASIVHFDHPTVFVSLDVQKYLAPVLGNVAGSIIFAREGVVEAETELRH